MLKHISALVGVLMLVLVGGHAMAQQFNLSDEELQRFFQQNGSATPEELAKRLRALNDQSLEVQRELSNPGYSDAAPPRLLMRRVKIYEKSPQSRAQDVKLAQGVITAITFVDEEFRSVPVANVTYDPGLFSVNGAGCSDGPQRGGGQAGGQGSGNVLNVFPCKPWVQTATINVMLQGSPQPIIFSATVGSTEKMPEADAQLTVEVSDGASNAFPEFASRRLTINPVDRSRSGVTPIYPGTGVITDVSFIDGSGNPWPIEEVVYQPSLVSVSGSQCTEDGQQGGSTKAGSGNVMYLSLCRDRSSNISVKLQGAPAALGLLLVSPGTDQSAMQRDVTLSVTVPGKSPTATATTNAAASALPNNNVDKTGFQPDRFLTDFANGTPPRGARFIQMLGAPNLEAYLYNGQLYVRGRYRPVNPSADASATSSSGGVNVWRYNKPVNSLLVASSATGQEYSLTADY